MTSAGNETFGEVLRRFRREARLTQEELAQRANMSARSISDLERGSRQRPYRDTLQLLAAALELSGERRAAFERAARAAPLPGSPAGSAPRQRHNLPLEVSSFIGRAEQLEQVRGLLLELSVRLVTMTGPGGSGKTRLALQIAASLADDFPDGIYFVNLAPITEPGLALSEVAQVLGVKEVVGQPLLDNLRHHLRERRLLLLLDNFEQVLAAAAAVAALLAAAPGLKILITSRVRLNLQGEHDYLVPPLRLPGADQGPEVEQLSRFEAVRLFVERARAMKADFRLDAGNAAAVAEICRRLDGLPLAIELAAARVKVLPPAALLARLAVARLGLLTGGARDLPARQQTLRSAIAWSHDLLDPREERLFRRLAVFVGGGTFAAIEKVAGAQATGAVGPGISSSVAASLVPGADVLDGVQSLVDKSLLRQEAGVAGEPRFTMLETIHEYAREKLGASGELEALRRRHALYFMQLAEQAAPELTGGQQTTWLARLEEEHDNLRAAISWSAGRGEQGDAAATQLAMSIAAALAPFWNVRGYLSEGRDQLERALGLRAAWSAAGPKGHPDQEEQRRIAATTAAIQQGLGAIHRLRGEYGTSRHYYEQALAIYREIGDRGSQARLLSRLGVLAHTIGDMEEARAFQTESLAVAHEAGNKLAIAVASHNLGNVVRDLGNYELARTLYEEALAIVAELQELSHISASLNNLANLALQVGGHQRALDLHRRSLELRGRLGNKMYIAESLIGIASVEIALGRLERGARLLGRAEGLADSTGGKFDPMERKLYDRALTTLSTTLDRGTLNKARQEGREMTPDEAVAYALEGST